MDNVNIQWHLNAIFLGIFQVLPGKRSAPPPLGANVGWPWGRPPSVLGVGGFNPSEKYESLLGSFFPIDGKQINKIQTTNQIWFTTILYIIIYYILDG